MGIMKKAPAAQISWVPYCSNEYGHHHVAVGDRGTILQLWVGKSSCSNRGRGTILQQWVKRSSCSNRGKGYLFAHQNVQQVIIHKTILQFSNTQVLPSVNRSAGPIKAGPLILLVRRVNLFIIETGAMYFR